jgi:hypothetical protein
MVLEHTTNTEGLGFVTDIHHDALCDGKPKKASTQRKKEEAKPKERPQCHRLKEPRTRTCPNCGFTTHAVSKINTANGELREVKKGKARKYSTEERQQWYSMLLGHACQRSYAPGWVAHKYREKFEAWRRGMRKIPIEPNPDAEEKARGRRW